MEKERQRPSKEAYEVPVFDDLMRWVHQTYTDGIKRHDEDERQRQHEGKHGSSSYDDLMRLLRKIDQQNAKSCHTVEQQEPLKEEPQSSAYEALMKLFRQMDQKERQCEPIDLPQWVTDNKFQRYLIDFTEDAVSNLRRRVELNTGSKKITGCYVLFNTDLKNKPYVGQAKDVFRRWGEYLRGHTSGGSDAFYQDMVVLGHHFKAIAIPLNGSPYDDLDKMERTLIEQYRAYEIGYNRTRGNK